VIEQCRLIHDIVQILIIRVSSGDWKSNREVVVRRAVIAPHSSFADSAARFPANATGQERKDCG
jgi:hypothetical protein